MTGGETAYLLMVIAATCTFMVVLGYESDSTRHHD